MTEEFLIARNPEEDSKLPFLLRIPLGGGIVVKSRETWPRTGKVYCHRTDGWPVDAEIVERVAVRSCVRRGAAIDLVLERKREYRSMFVLTRLKGGREAIFWQTGRTARQARPDVRTPTARAAGFAEMEIVVDSRERYAWKFAKQQVSTRVAALPAGDYAVQRDGSTLAAVERKSLDDLLSSLLNGALRSALTELTELPAAAVVVEERYSRIFVPGRVQPAVVADALGECQLRFPSVPVIFAETRALAQEWTYRFFGAALAQADQDGEVAARIAALRAEERD